MNAPARNQPCPCGSGKKYKHCCAQGATRKSPSPEQQSSIQLETGQLLPIAQAMAHAVQLHQAGRIRKAEAIYRQIVQKQPDHADALHLSGLINHQLGRHGLAYTLINQAIAIHPGAASFHNNLGEVCRALDRLDEALACYTTALSLQPDFPEVHRNIGLVHLASGETGLAVSLLHDAMSRFPDYLGIYWALGQALMNQRKVDEAIVIYDKGLERNASDSALLCAKGIALKTAGKLENAIRHYRHAIGLQPHVPELHHNLALVFQQQGNTEAAIACLKNELQLSPNAESAQHLLAALQNTPTDRAPASYVRETFDSYADGFDQHLVSKLAYHAPGLLAQSLRHAIGTPAPSLNILDLGCGTGLFGETIKDLKKSLVGVDLSPRMIDKARQRQIYDELIVGDILDYLAEANPSQFDLIAATDVFIYVGNLQPIFEQASRILAPGGWFTFSIEAPQNESGDFILDTTGRYQHHQTYLARLSTQFGFIQTKFSESCLRREKDQPVMGYLYLLKKS